MNILYLVNYFPPIAGAAAINTLEIVKRLHNFGHKILVLAPGTIGRNIIPLKSKNLLNISNLEVEFSSSIIKFPLNLLISHYENIIKYLAKYRFNFTPDIIISQYHPYHFASVAGAHLSKILKIPHVVRSHDVFIDLKALSISFRLFQSIIFPSIFKSITKCETFYATTSEMIRYLEKCDKLRKVNFKVHHNGIDDDLFFPIKNQDSLKDDYGCENIVIFNGILTPDVGIQDFIPILPEILRAHRDTHFIFLGEGIYKNYLIDFIKKNNLDSQVHFLGQKHHHKIPFYINNSDIGIGRITHKKIWRYCIPLKCLEYMACKKPFISTPISHDVTKNNEVGIIIKRDFSKNDVVDKFLMLLEDKDLQLKLGTMGYKKIQKEFLWKNIMDKFNRDLLHYQKC
ncbi:MAG: glycosyltransferase family 4 protein [Promethearchaeota archaeon]